jgi:hypothetical protein
VTRATPAGSLRGIDTPGRWIRLVSGLAAMFALFQWSAAALGSDRGQAGVAIGALIVASDCIVEGFLFGVPSRSLLPALGLGAPERRGLATAHAICLLMLLCVPAFAWATGEAAAFYPGGMSSIPGLFAQAGIAEEVLFRGYLFGLLPALLHFVIQGTVKIVVFPEASSLRFAVLWMAISAVVPMLVFVMRRDDA